MTLEEIKITLDDQIGKIISETENSWGSTFNLKMDKSLWGTKAYAVSPYIERTKIIEWDISKQNLLDFIRKNWDLLKQIKHSVGVWKDNNSWKTYIDVSITTDNQEEAIDIWKKYNQKAIFDLGNFEEIDTGGTGELKQETPQLNYFSFWKVLEKIIYLSKWAIKKLKDTMARASP